MKYRLQTPAVAAARGQIILALLCAGLAPHASAQLPNPNQGPGGPILVITSAASTYGRYYAEILRTEGLNEFAVADIGAVTPATLTAYDVAILAPSTLTAAQVTMFTDWVNLGGNLIAMRPDLQLGALLGITAAGHTLSNAYLVVQTGSAAGNGIASQPMQFHGTASLYALNGAVALATLAPDPTTVSSNPAVTLRSVGSAGGHASAFAYDLATSIVYTRQGNPAWAAQERDGFSPIRSNDKFYGAAAGDPQPDWVDLNNLVAIPQADEQQRLFANLILHMNLARKPLPRFWYFPNRKRAVVVMTGDDHGNGGTAGRFDQQIALSPAGCSVANWECIRSTSYVYPETANLSNAQVASYSAQGFEIGLHVNTDCADFTPASLNNFYSQQIAQIRSSYPSIPALTTQRHHCIAWSDWVTGAKTQFQYGMRLDTNYYFWPPAWAQNRPGHFTGSAMPMRFADLDGTIIDVYNAPTQMTDESGQSYPFTSDALLSAAAGGQGFFGVFTVNSHTDSPTNPVSDAVIPLAISRSVPVVSSAQMLRWLDARNSSSFSGFAWSGNELTFTITPASGATGLFAMLPRISSGGVLAGISGPGGPVAFSIETIKGLSYVVFPALAGAYTATYASDTTPPTVTSTTPVGGAQGVSQSSNVTVTFSEPMDPATITSSTFVLRDGAGAVVAAGTSYNALTLTAILTPLVPMAPSSTHTATVTTGVKDLSGNALAANHTWSLTTSAPPPCPCGAWNSSTVPATPSVNDPNPVELGVKFRVDLNGLITGVRFYKGAGNTGTHIGNLWSSTGQLLATATFSNETATGWQQVNFSAPVAVTANTIYVASYHTSTGNYAAENDGFAVNGVDSPPVHLLRDGISGGNGVYAYSTSSTFPSDTWRSSNYWVDVAFTTGSGPGPGPLSVITTTPASDATGVNTSSAVSATFNSALDPATVNASTFQVAAAGSPPVSGSYNVSGSTATFTPATPLLAGTTYAATLTTGIRNTSSTALAATYTWSFTTAATTPSTSPAAAGWFTGDVHVHRSCGGPPEALSSVVNRMVPQNLAVISLLADMGNGEVLNPTTDLPQVNGQDASVSTPGRIVRWDTEWHWDATYSQFSHQALGGHLLLLGLTSAQQLWRESTFEILDWAHQQGAIGGFAHMQYLPAGIPQTLDCCLPLEYPVEVALGAADFISEDVDDNGSPFAMNPENAIQAYYKLLNTGFRPGLAAGTDYPCNAGRDLGSLLTYVQVPGQLTYNNWIQGIKLGRTVVSRNGHREFLDLKVNTTAGPGDEVQLAAAGSVPVTLRWTATQPFTGTIELVSNGVVVLSQQASVTSGTPVNITTTVNFPKSGWVAARRMGADGHQLHTGAVFVIVNNAPIRASVTDAQFYVQWMDNLLTRTAPGGPWNQFFPTGLAQAQARYQAARQIFVQRAAEAAGSNPLGVIATAPSTGSTGVNPATTVTVTFSNPLNASTVTASTFNLKDAASVSVSATLNVNGSTATLTPAIPLTASTTYTATLTTGIRDVNGTALPADYMWSFTTSAGGGQSCTSNCTIWPATTLPGTIDQGPDSAVELGVRFRSDVNGTITGIRFYKAAANTGVHVGNLWSASGQLLASAIFTSETASGWQQVNFTTPVTITANTDYVASYHAAAGHYSQDQNFFATTGVDSPPLHALRDGVSGFNGIYAYGATSAFPNQTFNSANYWVDVVFNATSLTLTSIEVTPASPAIQTAATQQFTATGTYSNGSTQNITSQVTWASSTPTAAAISTAGLATAGSSAGTTTISATQGSISGSTTLTVEAATLTSIAVTPASPTIQTGATQQFTATGTYSNGSTQDITSQVTWASSTPTAAAINSAGLATAGSSAGTTTILATQGSISGSTTLTVEAPALTSIEVTPASPTIQTGATQQFTATGTYSNGSTQNITSQVTWASSTPTAAAISTAGLATAGSSAGTTTILATQGSISGSTTLTVEAPTLTSIAVTPASPTIQTGATQQFTATGTYSNGSTQNITSQVTWASSTPTAAGINSAGLATAGSSAGTTTISATQGSISGSTTLTVQAPSLTSITVTPASPTIQTGATQQFTATGTYSNGSTQNITSQVTWASSTPAVAGITSAGLATGSSAGTTTISATQGSVSRATTLTVQAATPPLTISTASLPGGTMGTTYSSALAAAGGTPPYTWSLAAGSLPAGLTLNAAGAITGTPIVSGTANFTVRVRDTAVPAGTVTRALSITIASAVINTGFAAPTANAAVTTSAGDNNGFQNTPANGYVTDGVFAVDPESGTNLNTSCTNAGKDKHLYYNYNLNVPTGTTIRGIEVQLVARVGNTLLSSPKMCVQISWNGGTTWTTAQATETLGTTTATYTLGSATDTWGRTWTPANLANTAFRVRIINVAALPRNFFLDSVAVRVTYQ